MNRQKGIIYIFISAIGYALMPIFSVIALKNGINVPTVLFMRFSTASIILWLYIFIKKLHYKVNKEQFIFITIISLLGFTITTVTLYFSYRYISASIATLILFTHPIFVVIITKIMNNDRKINIRKLVAIIITFIGLILILFDDQKIETYGIFLAFISSIAYGSYCIGLDNKRIKTFSGIVITAYVSSITAFATGIQCFIYKEPLFLFSKAGLITGLGLAFFSTIVASISFYEGLSIVGASSATMISTVEPVFVVIFSIIFLHDKIALNTFIGGIIILIGIYILERKPKMKEIPISKRKTSS